MLTGMGCTRGGDGDNASLPSTKNATEEGDRSCGLVGAFLSGRFAVVVTSFPVAQDDGKPDANEILSNMVYLSPTLRSVLDANDALSPDSLV